MKINRQAILVFLLLLVVATLPFASGNNSDTLDKLTTSLNIIATLAAAGGLLGLLHQFNREKNLSEADFTLRLNQSN